MSPFRWLLCVLVLVAGCTNVPAPPVDVHIPPSANHGCEVICKDGICTITWPFKYGCKSEGEAICGIENGQIRNGLACCPMYTACRACKCLKDGTYKGYCKDGVCIYTIPIAK